MHEVRVNPGIGWGKKVPKPKMVQPQQTGLAPDRATIEMRRAPRIGARIVSAWRVDAATTRQIGDPASPRTAANSGSIARLFKSTAISASAPAGPADRPALIEGAALGARTASSRFRMAAGA
jgi:hypothetical protein